MVKGPVLVGVDSLYSWKQFKIRRQCGKIARHVDECRNHLDFKSWVWEIMDNIIVEPTLLKFDPEMNQEP